MISILVLTDDGSAWVNKFQSCLNTLREHKTEDGYYLENPKTDYLFWKMRNGKKEYL